MENLTMISQLRGLQTPDRYTLVIRLKNQIIIFQCYLHISQRAQSPREVIEHYR